MRNWITKDIEVTVPILELLGTQPIQELCKGISGRSRLVSKLLLEENAS
jgi:hypothetical protein